MSGIVRVDVPGFARLPSSSHANVAGPTVDVSGILWADGEDLRGVDGGVEAETRRNLNRLQRVLAACGAGLDDGLEVTVYLTDMDHLATMNADDEFFTGLSPARITVGVGSPALGANVEMDCIAYRTAD